MKRIGLVGTGVIGSGWAVRSLARGYQIIATDPADGAEVRFRDDVERAWPSARKLGLFPGADPSQIEWVNSVKEVAESADFLQESVPEDASLKTTAGFFEPRAHNEPALEQTAQGHQPSRRP